MGLQRRDPSQACWKRSRRALSWSQSLGCSCPTLTASVIMELVSGVLMPIGVMTPLTFLSPFAESLNSLALHSSLVASLQLYPCPCPSRLRRGEPTSVAVDGFVQKKATRGRRRRCWQGWVRGDMASDSSCISEVARFKVVFLHSWCLRSGGARWMGLLVAGLQGPSSSPSCSACALDWCCNPPLFSVASSLFF